MTIRKTKAMPTLAAEKARTRDDALPVRMVAQSGRSAWLQPDELARLESLELRARGVVEGVMQGLHRSPFMGYSTEFFTHRRYCAGDDLRHVNWKLFARNRKLYVKEFNAETNLNLFLLVDCSRSMQCKVAGALTKFEYAAMLAASLACIASKQRDAIALGMIADGIVAYLEPSSKPGRWTDCVTLLTDVPTVQRTSLARGLEHAAALAKQRGVVIVFSDLIDEPSEIARGLQRLRHAGHEVVVFHILDPWERHLPAGGRVHFVDLESSIEVPIDVESVRSKYDERIDAWCRGLSEICLAQLVDRLEILTDSSPIEVLIDYLVRRQA